MLYFCAVPSHIASKILVAGTISHVHREGPAELGGGGGGVIMSVLALPTFLLGLRGVGVVVTRPRRGAFRLPWPTWLQ